MSIPRLARTAQGLYSVSGSGKNYARQQKMAQAIICEWLGFVTYGSLKTREFKDQSNELVGLFRRNQGWLRFVPARNSQALRRTCLQ